MNIRTQVVQTSERTSIVIKIKKITQIFREIGFENFNGRAHNSSSREIIPDSNNSVSKETSTNVSVRAKGRELKRMAPSSGIVGKGE